MAYWVFAVIPIIPKQFLLNRYQTPKETFRIQYIFYRQERIEKPSQLLIFDSRGRTPQLNSGSLVSLSQA